MEGHVGRNDIQELGKDIIVSQSVAVNNCLSQRQENVLSFLMSYLEENQRPPTIREICKAFDWKSPHAPSNHLLALERKGYIELDKNCACGIRLVGWKVRLVEDT